MGKKRRVITKKQINNIYDIERKSGISVAFAVSVISILIYTSTEILSLFQGINRVSIKIFWLLCILGAIFVVVFNKRTLRKNNLKKRKNMDSAVFIKERWDICLLILGWLLFLGYYSYKTVPCNYDSMTYHLARVANWIQNQSVDYYVTNIPRQLYSPVFSEYIILHLCLLFGNDVTVNLVQYISYVLCIYFLWDILKKLGFSNWTSSLASTLFASMPMAIAQSMTTQVDLNGCLWLLLFIDVILELIAVEKLTLCKLHIKLVTLCAISVVFGYLTKSNVCMLMLVFLIWLLFCCIKRKDDRKCLFICVGIAIFIIFLFATPIFIRNYLYTGSIFASSYMSGIMVGTFNPFYLLINIYKNFTLLAATNNLKSKLTSFGMHFAELLGVDINAPEISYTGSFCENLPVSYMHDLANNPVVAWLFLIASIIFLIFIFSKKQIMKKSFIGICFISILISFASLRYQVWGSRLLLPACAIMCLISAMVLENFNTLILKDKIQNRLYVYILLYAIIAAIPAVEYNIQYAIHYMENNNRFQMYFEMRQNYEQYEGICEYVKSLDVHKIGILLDSDGYEYPLWVRLKNRNTSLIQIVDGNKMKKPECIIAINQGIAVGDKYIYEEKPYTCIYNYENDTAYAVLIP